MRQYYVEREHTHTYTHTFIYTWSAGQFVNSNLSFMMRLGDDCTQKMWYDKQISSQFRRNHNENNNTKCVSYFTFRSRFHSTVTCWIIKLKLYFWHEARAIAQVNECVMKVKFSQILCYIVCSCSFVVPDSRKRAIRIELVVEHEIVLNWNCSNCRLVIVAVLRLDCNTNSMLCVIENVLITSLDHRLAVILWTNFSHKQVSGRFGLDQESSPLYAIFVCFAG